MNKKDCFELGYITKTHGLDGEVIFFLDVDDTDAYLNLDAVFLEIKGNLVPYFIESISKHKERFIVALEDVDTVEDAEALKGSALYLPLTALPKLEEGQFYYHDIIGFTVVDKQLGDLGTVTDVYTGGSQDVIAMKYKGVEVLIPVSDDIVGDAVFEKKQLLVNLPEGLLDVYLS